MDSEARGCVTRTMALPPAPLHFEFDVGRRALTKHQAVDMLLQLPAMARLHCMECSTTVLTVKKAEKLSLQNVAAKNTI